MTCFGDNDNEIYQKLYCLIKENKDDVKLTLSNIILGYKSEIGNYEDLDLTKEKY